MGSDGAGVAGGRLRESSRRFRGGNLAFRSCPGRADGYLTGRIRAAMNPTTPFRGERLPERVGIPYPSP
ncbi:hypothetical protein BCEN4_370100 [Burkholderia cenocepacia]|nr:hypothetical protein BCEN4_370100 [Burkholderia cenocepacia]